MRSNVGYIKNIEAGVLDTSCPLLVTGCGCYLINEPPGALVSRPRGRCDYQLLYIAGGRGRFTISGKEHTLTKGNMVLYRPDEPQMYRYLHEEQSEVFWVHFTGYAVDELLMLGGISEGENIFFSGTSPDYQWLFRQMIQELQLKRYGFEELLSNTLRRIFLLVRRHRSEQAGAGIDTINEVERAIHYFNENYNRGVSVEEYAEEHTISTCHFIQSFKRVVKMTPMQYIIYLRIESAKSLLESSSYNIAQIARSVGYDNALYFSRLFHKHTGLSPSAYRASFRGEV